MKYATAVGFQPRSTLPLPQLLLPECRSIWQSGTYGPPIVRNREPYPDLAGPKALSTIPAYYFPAGLLGEDYGLVERMRRYCGKVVSIQLQLGLDIRDRFNASVFRDHAVQLLELEGLAWSLEIAKSLHLRSGEKEILADEPILGIFRRPLLLHDCEYVGQVLPECRRLGLGIAIERKIEMAQDYPVA